MVEVARRCGNVTVLVLLGSWTQLGVMGKAFRGKGSTADSMSTPLPGNRQKSEATTGRFQPEAWEFFWQSVKNSTGAVSQDTHPDC